MGFFTRLRRRPRPPQPRVRARCSFCGRHQDASTALIAGPQGIAICDQCVALCSAMLAERAASQAVCRGSSERQVEERQQQ